MKCYKRLYMREYTNDGIIVQEGLIMMSVSDDSCHCFRTIALSFWHFPGLRKTLHGSVGSYFTGDRKDTRTFSLCPVQAFAEVFSLLPISSPACVVSESSEVLSLVHDIN